LQFGRSNFLKDRAVAGLGNQGAVKKGRGVKFYALAVSVCVHAVALSIFAAVKITQSAPVPLQTTAVVSISQAAALADRAAVTPKPKINPVDNGRPFDAASLDNARDRQGMAIVKTAGKGQSASVRPVFDVPTRDYRQQAEEIRQPVRSEVSAAGSAGMLPERAEFFGSVAQGRRICYVVDCSGSMQGLWQQVQKGLCESIGQLQPDQYFCVIVFGAGSILESSGGKMVRATERAKKDAYSFIDSLRPAGTTNALAAMQQAVKIRDETGVGPSLIYFLTDGFELSEQDNYRFAHQVATMLRSFAPKTQINTIGFWPAEQDRKLLETIAKDSGGEFVVVGDGGT
jgi:Mg-chelatase subunit ChlD